MPVNFTPVINTSEIITNYNVSYTYSQTPPTMTTPEVFFFCLIGGIALLLLSAILPLGKCSDLAGAISSLLLGLSTIYAWAVDTVTSFGVTSTPAGIALMENHTIYHFDLLGFVSGILLIVSFLNLWLLWLDHKRISEQEQQNVERMQRRPREMDVVEREDKKENGYKDNI